MTQPKRQFRDAMRTIAPPFLSDRGPTLPNTGFKWLWSIGMVLDAITEWIVQGAQAHLPGLGTPTALPFEGRSRGIRRGIAETDESYAARQQQWLESLKFLGHPFEILRQVRNYIGQDIKVRAVDFSGNWHTIDVGGAESWVQIPGSWNWNGSASYLWSQGHVIIYAPPGWLQWEHFWTGGDEPWGGSLKGQNFTLGQTTPYDVAQDLRALVQYVKPAHMVVVNIILAFDPDSFDPGNAATWPDGTWGNFTVGGDPVVESRPTTARYWEGVR